MSKVDVEVAKLRDSCLDSLATFAEVMHPDRYYGDVHIDFFNFLQYGEGRCKLGLIPRDHQKSHCMAVLATWLITLEPWITINYISANKDLILAQMGTIKHVLRTPQYRMLFPDMLNYESERGVDKHKPIGKWQGSLIEVDHHDRYDRAVRDPTVRASTVKSGNTGMHSDVTIFDDLVTDENFYSEADRRDVINCYKNFAKISTTGSRFYAVGTRYGENDLYDSMCKLFYRVRNEDGEMEDRPRWSVFQRVVEDSLKRTGDGNFLWPRLQMTNGEWYGFDEEELSIKKADLSIDGDITGFYSQYYNDPNDSSLNRLNREDFVYYDIKYIKQDNGQWYFKQSPLRVFAAADLAFTDGGSRQAKSRDFTALAVIGVDPDQYIYILQLERFQTGDYQVYYDRIYELHEFWGFREITIETNNGGLLVKKYVEDQIRMSGSNLIVHGKAHVSHEGKKHERIEQVLRPRYKNKTILHPKAGIIKFLEEELIMNRPPHDDLKDALALCIAEHKSKLSRGTGIKRRVIGNVVDSRSRFGGSRRMRRAG